MCSPSTSGGVVAATITQVDQHRDKVGFPLIPYVCTCRLVDRKEIEENPKAKQAMQSEWDRLRSRKAWDESNPREWSDVARDARQGGNEVHVGMIFGSVVEKNSVLPSSKTIPRFLSQQFSLAGGKMWPGKRGLAPNCLGPFFNGIRKRVHECTETIPAAGGQHNKR